MKSQRVFNIVWLSIVLLVFVGSAGWIWNIIKMTQSSFDVITGMFVARCIGVFVPPLGAVLGYL